MSKNYKNIECLWFWSEDKNGEIWEEGGKTIEQCIKDAEERAKSEVVHIAKGRKAKPSINISELLEDTCDNISEQLGKTTKQAKLYCKNISELKAHERLTLQFKIESTLYQELKDRNVPDVYKIDKPLYKLTIIKEERCIDS